MASRRRTRVWAATTMVESVHRRPLEPCTTKAASKFAHAFSTGWLDDLWERRACATGVPGPAVPIKCDDR